MYRVLGKGGFGEVCACQVSAQQYTVTCCCKPLGVFGKNYQHKLCISRWIKICL